MRKIRKHAHKNTALLLGCMLEPKWMEVHSEDDTTVQTMPDRHLCPKRDLLVRQRRDQNLNLASK